MRTTPSAVEAFTIWDAPKLDPIAVVLNDLGSGCGHLLIACYGEAWAAYWGAMGSENLRLFITSAHADYIANRLWPQHQRRTKIRYGYLLRIVEAVQEAMRAAVSASPSQEPK